MGQPLPQGDNLVVVVATAGGGTVEWRIRHIVEDVRSRTLVVVEPQ
jgi:hypothetical protein